MKNIKELNEIAKQMVAPGKGILAADESTDTIGKRFSAINLENTEENRRAYRELLFTTPDIGKYISGVIMYDETIHQKTEGENSFVSVLQNEGVLPGIKVDQGTIPDPNSPDEKITKGLEGLPERLKEYASIGAKFAKWRTVITINENYSQTDGLPTEENLKITARDLAQYAKYCQEAGIVPIVEPEVLMDGSHKIEKCEEVTEKTLNYLFEELNKVKVQIEGIILKPNMIVPGKNSGQKTSPEEVAKATISLFKKVLPENLPGIVFLSGGQSEVEATENLNAMNQIKDLLWRLSFSYGRALQESTLKTWAGKKENVPEAQKVFLHRAKMNSLATLGKYSLTLEEGDVA